MSVTKVKRYWPGKAPEWADVAFPLMTDCQISRKDDPRLRRLAESRLIDRAEVRAEHRRIRQAEIIFTEEEKEESRGLDGAGAEEEDEDAMEDRRRRIREKLVQRQEEEETAEYENETDSESEYETDSDTVKPAVLFVPKSERDTVTEREQMEAEEMALEAAARRLLEERKVETKQIVVEKIREEEAAAAEEDVETDDELNEAEEYERWKAREIGRMTMIKKKRDRGATESMAEDEPKKKQKRMRFLQKYYHKGAFFQSHADDQRSSGAADAIYTRDFSSPTGEDKMDKTILPKVMQVKHFGRSGRTKWTHLLDQDTTDPWTYNSPLRTKYNKLMADMYKPIEKPKGSNKLKDCELRCVLLILAPDK